MAFAIYFVCEWNNLKVQRKLRNNIELYKLFYTTCLHRSNDFVFIQKHDKKFFLNEKHQRQSFADSSSLHNSGKDFD